MNNLPRSIKPIADAVVARHLGCDLQDLGGGPTPPREAGGSSADRRCCRCRYRRRRRAVSRLAKGYAVREAPGAQFFADLRASWSDAGHSPQVSIADSIPRDNEGGTLGLVCTPAGALVRSRSIMSFTPALSAPGQCTTDVKGCTGIRCSRACSVSSNSPWHCGSADSARGRNAVKQHDSAGRRGRIECVVLERACVL